jgi:hypothetical protein
MALIVGVHGAFHELWGPHQVAGRWIPAMRDGLGFAGVSIEPSDAVIAFYGDVFRADPDNPISDTELLGYEERAGILDAAGSFIGQDGLEAFVAHIGREQIRQTLAQLGRYFGDESVRQAVQDRVRSAIGPDTKVVVAHSLGSVVAYEVLAGASDISVHLVTIGSPLGQHGVVGHDLRPALRDGKGTWPPSVRTWTDITSVGDPVADGHPVADVFDGVTSFRVDNGHRAHDPEPYLCAAVTGAAIRAGLEPRSG